MSVEAPISVAAPNTFRRGPAEKLRQAIAAMANGQAQILPHTERAWASITFSGARHTLTLVFDGLAMAKSGEEFIAALPDQEFVIPGHLVADAAIISVDHTMIPDIRLVVTVELLVLIDA